MPENFEKIINLIRKTGDNCIILDYQGNPAYVITTFKKYHELVFGKSEVTSLNEGELADKINCDIAFWKESQETEDSDNWQDITSVINQAKREIKTLESRNNPLSEAKNSEELDNVDNSEEKYYFEPID